MWPDETGDWGTLTAWDNGGFTEASSAAATALDASPINASGGKATGTNDQYSGFFTNLLGTVVNYGIQKDAKQNGLSVTTSATGQPVVRSSALAGGAAPLLLLAGLAFLALKH